MFSVSRLFPPSEEKTQQRKQDIIERAKSMQKMFPLSKEEKDELWKNIS
ncbi:hypothetical protein D1R32_gp254 [Tunisvirus fontaine2]|uniref:Uncharacterized protein n=1 Tax=Tunisvirus fontaine2 TaxID=1421067 RepID=V9SF74_9VIRU|nr:hypothetical protein D1R32_gp254 [Tunisvirus fontaine2]AHC54971.1 hypothetical protein TNS_ORF253 [Tunisvirus fontaine2]